MEHFAINYVFRSTKSTILHNLPIKHCQFLTDVWPRYLLSVRYRWPREALTQRRPANTKGERTKWRREGQMPHKCHSACQFWLMRPNNNLNGHLDKIQLQFVHLCHCGIKLISLYCHSRVSLSANLLPMQGLVPSTLGRVTRSQMGTLCDIQKPSPNDRNIIDTWHTIGYCDAIPVVCLQTGGQRHSSAKRY